MDKQYLLYMIAQCEKYYSKVRAKAVVRKDLNNNDIKIGTANAHITQCNKALGYIALLKCILEQCDDVFIPYDNELAIKGFTRLCEPAEMIADL